MEKATDWIKSHKPHTAAIAIAIIAVVAVVIAAASGAFSTADKQNSTAKAEAADLVLNVTADTGWDANSTPAIAISRATRWTSTTRFHRTPKATRHIDSHPRRG